MPILLAITLVPTLSFYFYVLVQFAKEAIRRRRRHTRALVLPLKNREYDALEMREHEPRVDEIDVASQISQPSGTQGARAAAAPPEVLPAHLKNRFVVYASQTGRLAAKRAVKG